MLRRLDARWPYFVFVSQGQLWARREADSLLYKVSREPVQLHGGNGFLSGKRPQLF